MNYRSGLLSELAATRTPIKTSQESYIKKLILENYFRDFVRSDLTGFDVLKTFVEKFSTARQESSIFWNKRSTKLSDLRKDIIKEHGTLTDNFKLIKDQCFDGKITNIKIKNWIEEYNNLY